MTEHATDAEVDGFAFLYCMNCNKIWGLAEPGNAAYGIVIEPDKEYLTHSCHFCSTEDSYKLDKVESFQKTLNFSKIRNPYSEIIDKVNIGLHQLDEYIQRLWAEMGLQVCPST